MIRFVMYLVLLFASQSLMAQDVTKHQWEDRLVVLIANSQQNSLYQKQLNRLQTNEAGLHDRKIVVYHLLPNQSGTGLRTIAWQPNTAYQQWKAKNNNFRVVLIGLDGEIKMDENTVIPIQTLFNTIDSMPMRQRELERRKQKDQ